MKSLVESNKDTRKAALQTGCSKAGCVQDSPHLSSPFWKVSFNPKHEAACITPRLCCSCSWLTCHFPSAGELKTGYLEKRVGEHSGRQSVPLGESFKWQKRYFVLTEPKGMLYYFKSADDPPNYRGVINLRCQQPPLAFLEMWSHGPARTRFCFIWQLSRTWP